MLIDFEPAANCTLPSALKLAPLPAKRRLWEATDATLWKQSYHELGPEIIFGLAADGELVEVDDDQLSCADAWLTYTFPDGKTPSMHTQSWDEWLAGIDSFGGLVMLAASLDD